MSPYNDNESSSLAPLTFPTPTGASGDGGPVGPTATGASIFVSSGNGTYSTPLITTHSLCRAHHAMCLIMISISSPTMIIMYGSTPSAKGM